MSNLDDLTRMFLEQTLSEKLAEQREAQENEGDDYPVQVQKLRKIYGSFYLDRDYDVGDIVVWKDGLKNRKLPSYGQPAIVVEFLDECKYAEEEETGSMYFHEPLNVRLGFIGPDGDFVSYLFDARKFRKASLQ